MPTRITLSDPKLFPIQAFFNAVSDSSFVQVVDHLTKGIGYSINVADCSFPGDLDPGEESFDGVCFSIYEDEVVISNDQLRHYLQVVCDDYTSKHPEDERVLKEYLGRLWKWGNSGVPVHPENSIRKDFGDK